MIQPVRDTYRFDLKYTQYMHIRTRSLLFFFALVVCVIVAITLSSLLWKTYTHNFTPYLKWQDALVALSYFIAFTASGGCILIARFLHALHAGRTRGMVTIGSDRTITVRDLSAENLLSIFWIMNSAFWCFVAVLVGLLPAILIGWTLHLSNSVLVILTTSIAVILCVAGLILSIVSLSFVVIGCIGSVSFCRRLGSSHIYSLNGQATIRIDNFVLTITYPGKPESMIDLRLLEAHDQRQLLSLLHKRWVDAERVWGPSLGEEIELALKEAKLSAAIAY